MPDVSDMSIEPHITALVRADGTGEVSVNGETFPVFANDIEGIRAAIIDRVAQEAAALDRPVQVATTDLDGIYPLLVHPDGGVDSNGPMIPLGGEAEASDGAHAAQAPTDADADSDGSDTDAGSEADTAAGDTDAQGGDDSGFSGAESAAEPAGVADSEDRGWRLGDDDRPSFGDSAEQPSSDEDQADERADDPRSPDDVDTAGSAAGDTDETADTDAGFGTAAESGETEEGADLDDGAPRPSGSVVIPPPPFGIDDLVAPDDADEAFVASPVRRSTFQSFDAALGFADETPADSGSQDERLLAPESGPLDGGRSIFGVDAASDEDGAGSSAPVLVHPVEDAPDRALGPDFGVPVRGDAAGDDSARGDTDLDRPAPGLNAFSPAPDAAEEAAPTLDDFLQSRPSAPVGPAKKGWQGLVRRITGGLISPNPGKAERAHRDAIERVQRSLKGPRTIVVLNPKGGAHKTTATLLLAATFGIHRGGSTLAWDNNETRGTLGWRAQPSRHSNTAVDLLRDLDKFADVKSARVGYLDNYVRAQGDAQFDVLASDEDAAASSTIDAVAFRSLHHTLSRFYRVLVIDTGNNMRASNWEAAVDAADQLVVVTTVNEETAASAAWLLDGLRQKGHQDKVSQAVTILSSPGDTVQPELSRRLHAHFAALTRVVLEVPYDPGFQSGGPLNVDVLSPRTREAWLQVTAAVADGL